MAYMGKYSKAAERYSSEAVYSASSRKQFILLYERLLVDLDRADLAFASGDLNKIHEALRHAQDIVHLLMTSLREDIWPGAVTMRELYGFALGKLVQANLTKDVTLLEDAASILRPIGETWREADRVLDASEGALDGVA